MKIQKLHTVHKFYNGARSFPRRYFPRRSFPRDLFPLGLFLNGLFPAGFFPAGIFPAISSNNKPNLTKTNQAKPNYNLT